MIWGKSPHFSMDKYAKKTTNVWLKQCHVYHHPWGMVMTGAWFMAWPPHFLNPFRWVKVKKSKSQTVPLPVTRPQLDLTCHFVFRKCGTEIFEENECPWCFCTRGVFCSRTTCAWSAMVICTARVSASPMHRSAWSLARSVWCYQSLGDDKGDAGRESLTYATRWCPIVS